MNKYHIVCFGVDPGASGAISAICINEQGIIQHVDSLRFSQHSDRDLLLFISDYLETLTYKHNSFAYLEQVHSMPGQGVSSTFKFGMAFGKAIMALQACGVSFSQITPSQWQKEFGMLKKGKSKTEHKRLLKQLAQQKLANFNHPIVNENADAMLLGLLAKDHFSNPF